MNWTKIKEKYPKGYKVVDDWFHKNGWMYLVDPVSPDRDLYDFFDEQGIYVLIGMERYDDGDNWEWHVFPYTCIYGDNGEYDTRTEAEEAAFEKAFEILETKADGGAIQGELREKEFWECPDCAFEMHIQHYSPKDEHPCPACNEIRLENELREKDKKYHELIMAVENKYPNETRHETALRYIKEAEKPVDAIGKSNKS